MLDRILAGQQEVLLSEERGVLRQLLATLARYEATRDDVATLEQSLRRLDELFLLVVVGEFNSGKSTFINALVGRRILREGVTPTTSRIHRIRYGEKDERAIGPGGIEEISAPIELLRHLQVVDTPGTNALDRHHETLTTEFVPQADSVLFVTSADRPFTESERSFMEGIREWGKKLVVIVNKIDFLGADEVGEVLAFVEENATRLLGSKPAIFPVSARAALNAKANDDSPALTASRFPELERYLVETLDESERVRLKLLSPVRVGRRLATRYRDAAAERIDVLAADSKALDEIETQLDLYGEDMAKEFRFRLTDVDNELHQFEKRGDEYFEDTLRLTRAFDLINKPRLEADFARKVIADTPARLEAKVEAIIDWMVEAELRQWQTTSRQLAERSTEESSHSKHAAGEMGRFDYNRAELLDTVGRVAQRTIAGYDQRVEAGRLARSVQNAVAGTALLEAGAIGLGAAFTVLATTQVADVTGMLAAGTLAILGLFVLPAKRRRAKREFAAKILALREKLMSVLTEEFDREVERSAGRIREAVTPYSRFVRGERRRLEAMQAELDGSLDNLERLETLIEAI